METATKTRTREGEENLSFQSNGSDRDNTTERLNSLLNANAEYDRIMSGFLGSEEKLEADIMENPLSVEKAYSYFGLLLGTLPPAALFGKFIFQTGDMIIESWVILLMLFATMATALVGYLSGKIVAKGVVKLEKYPWWMMIVVLPFMGFLWGVVAGSSGGFFLLVIGAIFGGFIGGLVGAAALPAFTIYHRIFQRADKIEKKHFFPAAFGISLIISVFVLGL